MKWKALIAAVVMLGTVATAHAENPKMEEMRAVTATGRYVINWKPSQAAIMWDIGDRYNIKNSLKGIAVDGESRVLFAEGKIEIPSEKKKSGGLFGVGGLFGAKNVKGDTKKAEFIIAMLKEGNFYRYGSICKMLKNNILYTGLEGNKLWYKKLGTDQMNDENINPEEGWEYMYEDLAIPYSLRVLAPNDKYNDYGDYEVPVFVETVTEENNKDKDKATQCDLYVMKRKKTNGIEPYELQVRYYYSPKDGTLERVETYAQLKLDSRLGKKGLDAKLGKKGLELVEKFLNVTISPEIPAETFTFHHGTKVFEAGTGDINDLLGSPAIVEEY